MVKILSKMRKAAVSISLFIIVGAYTGTVPIFSNVVVAAYDGIYYVATTGDDSNAGTIDRPFKTISKASSVLKAGDTCVIRGGDYHESMAPVNSGTEGSPITYKSYPNETVTISGCDSLTGWTLDQGNTYKATMNWDMGAENQVFVNGTMMKLAQYPNWTNDTSVFDLTSFARMDSGTATSITDAELNKPDNYWVGATVIVKGWWSTQSAIVTSSKGSTVNFSTLGWSDQYTNPCAGAKYTICGKYDLLDRDREWYYDKNTSTLYLRTPNGGDPNTMVVEAKKRKYAFDLTGRSYINIENVNILGSSITTNNANHCNIIGIKAQYLSHTINLQTAYSYDDTGIDLSGSYNTIRDSQIIYSSGNGVVVRGNNNNVINNEIHETDYMGTYNACVSLAGGNQHLVSHNTLYNTGRILIEGAGFWDSIIEYNDISKPGRLSFDFGAMYFCRTDGGNSEIRYNLVHDSTDQDGGIQGGIDFDSNVHSFLVHHNTVWNCDSNSFYYGGRDDNIIFYDNQGTSKAIANTSDYKYNNQFLNNIVQGGVSFENGAAEGPAGYQEGNVTTGFDKNKFGTAGCNFQNPPNPVFQRSAQLPEYRNLSLNYGFENTMDGWTKTGNSNATLNHDVIIRLNDQNHSTRSADYSVKLGDGQNGIEQKVTGLTPNTSYTYSGWARVAAGEEAWLGAKDFGGADTHTAVTDTATGWKHVIIKFTTGQSNTSATIYMWKNSTGSGTVFGDDIGLCKTRIIPTDPNLIPQSQMTATATSEEAGKDPASNAIDGDPSTIWNTKWDKSDKLAQSITLNLGGTYDISKVEYLPRQDGGINGIITKYNLYVSTDGQAFTKIVADGIWKLDSSKKTAAFSSVNAKYVKLEAVEAGNGWGSAAEINVYKGQQQQIFMEVPQSQMKVTATSEEALKEPASNAIDGNPSTIWNTKWDKSDKLPQSITLNLGGTYDVAQVKYLPRQDGAINGRITRYNMYASINGTDFTKVIDNGIWANDNKEKTATFVTMSGTVKAAYIMLEAIEGINGWASAAEITVEAKPATLKSITTPTAITGLANGTAKTAAALGLPTTVTLVTDAGNVNANVTWNVDGSSYDPSTKTEQNFIVSGTVALPIGVVNPNSIAFQTSISVNVYAIPELKVPSDLTVEATGVKTPVNIGTAEVTNVPDVIITNNAPADYPIGTTTVIWTATDKGGNTVTAMQKVIVVDSTEPTISVAAPLGSKTTDTFTVEYSATDIGSGVNSIEATLNGIKVTNGQVISLASLGGTNTLNVVATDNAGNKASKSVTFETVIVAKVDVNPNTLNLKSKGGENSFTAYIELPEGYDVLLADFGSMMLSVNEKVIYAKASPLAFGDYDMDNVKDLMVKFDRAEIIAALGSVNGDISITISGKLSDGKTFEGSDTIKVIH
ncbi:discoidin domain-containing protein [Clostridium estertheticum]|uniref:discoidin domain-containing protein n=1 Tax=Clostridium estertheticum TaxID=238834 RepID=UPI0013E95CC7|nr:discoidin domain-containing protein [Clostridium estertheticum]MBZ9685957.1 discoidin domain-containing protein [Clostridium estertheticum]